ncbi:response regulator [Rivularia sp. UHCC 0363]|uniref:response regulator n=1 Tax=Rivularia sp. UHCC 0363 TaxID=3110244 RepID=UPI002B1F6304|nr:response regulator [Rivularia sp. UHCC 0363]MEA5593574.1 response regulator [Rivularia sp. UHCC 0363]
MQGNLSEIDIRSILQLIELGQRTGLLFIQTDDSCSGSKFAYSYTESSLPRTWFVFFLNGQIIYSQEGNSSVFRLRDYLRYYRINLQGEETPSKTDSDKSLSAPEYAYLWRLLEQDIINPIQARSIIHGLVHETLFDLLSLRKGNFIFELDKPLAPQLTTLEIAPLVSKVFKQLQEWNQLSPFIQSPDQCPVLTDVERLRSSLASSTVEKLQHWTDGKTSLRQLARYLNRDVLTLAKAIYPYVQQGLIHIVSDDTVLSLTHKDVQQPPEKELQAIVCIDDAVAICERVQSILQLNGYNAIAFTNPLEALNAVFQIQPLLILCDIVMPDLDGYELCAMLRHSSAFRVVPIIMLSGKSSYIDRVRANMVGATDYLTKPFDQTELLLLIRKHLAVAGGAISLPHGHFGRRSEDANADSQKAALVD